MDWHSAPFLKKEPGTGLCARGFALGLSLQLGKRAGTLRLFCLELLEFTEDCGEGMRKRREASLSPGFSG